MWSQENPNLKEPIMKAERAGTGNPYRQKIHSSQLPDQSHPVNSHRRQPSVGSRNIRRSRAKRPAPDTVPASVWDFLTIRVNTSSALTAALQKSF